MTVVGKALSLQKEDEEVSEDEGRDEQGNATTYESEIL